MPNFNDSSYGYLKSNNYGKDLNNNLWKLSGILNSTIFETINSTNQLLHDKAYSCVANLFSGGIVSSADNDLNSGALNYTAKSPLVFIHCSNNTNDKNPVILENIMQNAVRNISDLMTYEGLGSGTVLAKTDKFYLGMLLICFGQISICIAYWMLFTVVVLLPADDHNRQNKLVLILVLFSAITEAIILNRTVINVIQPQYYNNYQRSEEYESIIINSNLVKSCDLIYSVFTHFNWLLIIIYMYPTVSLKWVEHVKMLPNGVRHFKHYHICLAIILMLIDDILFCLLLWTNTKPSIHVAFKSFEIIIYTIFCLLLVYFVWSNFAFVLRPKVQKSGCDIDTSETSSKFTTTNETCDNCEKASYSFANKSQNIFVVVMKKGLRLVFYLFNGFFNYFKWSYYHLKVLWKDYQDILPLLAYNIVLFGLSYWATIFFTMGEYYHRRWAYNIVYFLRALITVNVWALIGVLEKKKIIASRKTVLGRQIRTNSFNENRDIATLGDHFISREDNNTNSGGLISDFYIDKASPRVSPQRNSGEIYESSSANKITPHLNTAKYLLRAYPGARRKKKL